MLVGSRTQEGSIVQQIESMQKAGQAIAPPPEFTRNARIKDLAEYERLYRQSIEQPDAFWAQQAEENLAWIKKWDKVVESDFSTIGQTTDSYVRYFISAKLNVSANCLDRHVASSRKSKTALIWQGEKEDEKRTVTYQQLHRDVCRFANVLKKRGVGKGTTVTIFMPMVPEMPVALLACARVGAIHSVVFSAFSPDSLKSRIQDCGSQAVITSDVGFHAGKIIDLKNKVDTALKECPTVKTVIVYNLSLIHI
jgi:acetyl-CoA synthetase